MNMIKDKLEDCNIEINSDGLPNDLKEENDLNSFLYDFDDLNNEERREICEVLENNGIYATSPREG